MHTEHCSINEPTLPSHAANSLIRKHLLKSGDLPWVNDMAKAWGLMGRLAELAEDGLIGIDCIGYIPKDTPTSQRIMSFNDAQVLPDDLEGKAFYHCFFHLPLKEEANALVANFVWYDFLHERAEMAIYAMATKVAELVRDGVIHRNWLREETEFDREWEDFLEYHLEWIEREDSSHEC